MKTYYKILLLVFLTTNSIISGQTTTGETSKDDRNNLTADFGLDLVTRYIWRGCEVGVSPTGNSVPHLQPFGALNYSFTESSSLSFGLWGSYGFDGSFAENDIYITYAQSTSAGDFSLTFTDYIFPNSGIPFSSFEGEGNGAHTFDIQIGYKLPEAFPLSLLFGKYLHNDLPGYKSVYLEASYPLTISNIELQLFAGAANGPSFTHEVTTDKFEFINTGFKAGKSIKISEGYSLPLSMAFIYNHHKKKTFLVFKATI